MLLFFVEEVIRQLARAMVTRMERAQTSIRNLRKLDFRKTGTHFC
jgi:hypothetical protein